MLEDCLCRDVKLTKNADPYKCSYFGYGVGFDLCLLFQFQIVILAKILLFMI